MKEEFQLRKATKEDMDLLFQWANDPVTRQQSFSTKTISYEEHVQWWEKMEQSPNQVQYIFCVNNEPVGQVRVTIKEKVGEIGYSIKKEMRGLGLGKKMLKILVETFHEEHPDIDSLIGLVKKENTSSKRCFESLGFQEVFSQFEFNYNMQEK